MMRLVRLPKSFALVLIVLASSGFFGIARAQEAKPITGSAADGSRARLVVQLGHSGILLSAVFSPSGKYVLTGALDSTTIIWETETGREIKQLAGYAGQIGSVAFLPDDKQVYLIRPGPSVQIWNIESGQLTTRFQLNKGVMDAITLSRDGRLLLTGSPDGSIRIWDVNTGVEKCLLQKANAEAFNTVVFSPDGQLLLTGNKAKNENGFSVSLWETATGKEKRRFEGQPKETKFLAFSPDGKMALTANANKDVRILNIDSGQEVRRFEGEANEYIYHTPIFSRDSKSVFISGNSLQMFDIETGKEIKRFGTTDYRFEGMDVSQDGRYLLTSVTAVSPPTALLWDIETETPLQGFAGVATGVRGVQFSAGGDRLLTNSHTINQWDWETGAESLRLTATANIQSPFTSFASSKDGKYLVTSEYSSVFKISDAVSGKDVRSFGDDTDYQDTVLATAFSPDGKTVLTGHRDKTARIWEAQTGKEVRRLIGHSDSVRAVAFSADGKTVLTGSFDHTARVWDVKTGRELQRFARNLAAFNYVAFSPDGRYVLTNGIDNIATLWDVRTGKEARRFLKEPSLGQGENSAVALSPDGRYVATASFDNTARLWDVESGKELKQFIGNATTVYALAFSPDGRFLATGSDDGLTRIWSIATGIELCSLISFLDGSWVVIDSEGHFDTNNLERLNGLHWIMAADPMKTLPIEIFMRGYYEPRLLARRLNGEPFKPVRNLSELNRVQPDVKIAGVERQKDKPDLVTITIEVAKATGEFKSDKGSIKRETGVYDLRLFRDGQIVGQFPREADTGIEPATQANPTYAQELAGWQERNRIELDSNGKRTIKFENIRLPRTAGVKDVEFTAYAFNEDRVKSRTDSAPFDIPAELAPRRPRAYLITIGVNAYDNPAFDLKYSVNDARSLQQTIYDRLSKLDEFKEIVQVPLISDAKIEGQQRIITENLATKSNLKAVLDLLAGRQVDAEIKKQIPDAEKIGPANPEDLVLISFSSHGYADADGNFYFILSDTGKSEDEKVTEELVKKLRPRFLSSEELSLWLRDVDAGEMMMIVDACHSAAAVAGGEFKPGPMGSRGLGQLSYDKGMRILTATQAADVAYGIGALKQGLLTYVLVKGGIEEGKADFKPVDKRITISEWLGYGEVGVPKLLEEAGNKAKAKEAPVEIKDLVRKTSSDIRTQRPSLFDFSRKKRDFVLVGQ